MLKARPLYVLTVAATADQALDLARNKGATMLDDIWKELARAKFLLWTANMDKVNAEKAALLQAVERALTQKGGEAEVEATVARVRKVRRHGAKLVHH
eukprot:179023-Pyramimonas_sp.AAC.1